MLKRMKLWAWVRCGLAALCLVSLSTAADASVAEIYGFGSRAIAMGGAFTAVADDYSAVYYNPAGLATQQQPEYYFNHKGFRFELGFLYADPELWVKRLDGQRLELQLPGFEAFPGGQADPDPTAGFNMGFVFEPFDLGGLLPRRAITLGLGVHIPMENAYWWRPQIPEEIHYIFHEDYTGRAMVMPGVAYKITDRLSVGLGISLLFKVQTYVSGPIDVPVTPEGFQSGHFVVGNEGLFFGNDFTFEPRIAPIVGILFRPWDALRVGVTYRGELSVKDYGSLDPIMRFALPGVPIEALPGIAVGFHHEFVHFYSPHEVAFGVAVCPSPRWLISLDGTWMNWSGFLERERVSNPKSEPTFEDTVVPRVGVAYNVTDRIRVRCGYGYYDSPVPEQRWGNNDLDNTRHIFSFGSDFLFGPLIASCHVQYQHFVERSYRKLDPEDPYGPGLKFGGHTLGAGLNLSMAF